MVPLNRGRLLPLHDNDDKYILNFTRFTDFLVYEVGLDGQVVHIKTLAMPSTGVQRVSEISWQNAGPQPQLHDNPIGNVNLD